MNDTPTKDEACTETAVAFAEAEIAWRRYHHKLCKLAESALRTQKVCGDDDDPIHAMKFASMQLFIAQALDRSSGSNSSLANAHEDGDEICRDCEPPIIVTGGGGGK